MPIDVGKFTTEVTAIDGELPLSPTQMETLVQAVVRRIEEAQAVGRIEPRGHHDPAIGGPPFPARPVAA